VCGLDASPKLVKTELPRDETRAALYDYGLAGLACSRKHNRTHPLLCIHVEDQSARVTISDTWELTKRYEEPSLETQHQQKVCEYPLFTLLPQCVQVVYLNTQQHRSEVGAPPLLGMTFATCIARTAQRRVGFLGVFSNSTTTQRRSPFSSSLVYAIDFLTSCSFRAART